MKTPDNLIDPKILVLLDLDKSAINLLSVTNLLAQRLNGSVKALHVKEPAKVVKRENQLSAKKELYQDSQSTQQQLESFLKIVSRPIGYELVYGNIKNSVMSAIGNIKPDIIVMGKRSKKLGGILGDRLTEAVIDSGRASVFVVDSSRKAPDSLDFSVGVFADENDIEMEALHCLYEENPSNIKYFSIEKAGITKRETNHFVFPDGSNAIDNLASYAAKTKTELFYIPRGTKKGFSKKMVHKLRSNVVFLH